MKSLKLMAWALLLLLLAGGPLLASEADLAIPNLRAGTFFGGAISAWTLLFCGALVICGTLGISLYLRAQIYKLPAHKSMLDIAEIIFQTCKTYLVQQGKFLLMLFLLIAIAITYYLVGFGQQEGYAITDRTIQELELYPPRDRAIPAETITTLKGLIGETFETREEYLKAIEGKVGD